MYRITEEHRDLLDMDPWEPWIQGETREFETLSEATAHYVRLNEQHFQQMEADRAAISEEIEAGTYYRQSSLHEIDTDLANLPRYSWSTPGEQDSENPVPSSGPHDPDKLLYRDDPHSEAAPEPVADTPFAAFVATVRQHQHHTSREYSADDEYGPANTPWRAVVETTANDGDPYALHIHGRQQFEVIKKPETQSMEAQVTGSPEQMHMYNTLFGAAADQRPDPTGGRNYQIDQRFFEAEPSFEAPLEGSYREPGAASLSDIAKGISNHMWDLRNGPAEEFPRDEEPAYIWTRPGNLGEFSPQPEHTPETADTPRLYNYTTGELVSSSPFEAVVLLAEQRARVADHMDNHITQNADWPATRTRHATEITTQGSDASTYTILASSDRTLITRDQAEAVTITRETPPETFNALNHRIGATGDEQKRITAQRADRPKPPAVASSPAPTPQRLTPPTQPPPAPTPPSAGPSL